MTNFQGGTPARVTREQILLWTPVALGGVVALAAAVLMLLPAVQQLSRKQQELTDLKEQEARVPLLRQQLTQQQETLEEAQQREKQILQLIAGSGDISTFMAQLSREARSSGVQLDSYEPVTAPAAPATTPPAGQTPPAAPNPPQPAAAAGAAAAGAAAAGAAAAVAAAVDPLVAPGLQKTSVLITAKGTGPQLQDFLRRLERLSLLVAQSDLSLKTEVAQATEAGKTAASGLTTLKLTLSVYSKASAASASPAALAPSQPAPAAPAKS
jgi:type IV pilus assembly protein PilO